MLSATEWVRLCVHGAVMTVGALAAYQIGDRAGGAVLGATMLLVTLSLFHLAAALLCRDQRNTIFDRDAVPGAMQLRRYGVSLAAIFLVTALDFMNRIFGTTAMSLNQWCICAGIAVSLVVVEELIKAVLRHRAPGRAAPGTQPLPTVPSVA